MRRATTTLAAGGLVASLAISQPIMAYTSAEYDAVLAAERQRDANTMKQMFPVCSRYDEVQAQLERNHDAVEALQASVDALTRAQADAARAQKAVAQAHADGCLASPTCICLDYECDVTDEIPDISAVSPGGGATLMVAGRVYGWSQVRTFSDPDECEGVRSIIRNNPASLGTTDSVSYMLGISAATLVGRATKCVPAESE